MGKKFSYSCIVVAVLALFLTGCASQQTQQTVPAKEAPQSVKSIKDYPDNLFNPDEYIEGMERGGHNLLIWQDPSANLQGYNSVKIEDFEGRLLPKQDQFSYSPFIKHFNIQLENALNLDKKDSPNSLLIQGEVVECNPGSRAARYWAGFGAGKAAGAVACEVYEPGKSVPSIRVYARDTASSGAWGGDSVSMLNRIFELVAVRVATVLEGRVGK